MKKKKEKELFTPVERVLELLEIPKEAVLREPYIELSGDSRISVENHKGVIEYSRECIKLAGGKYIIKITGAALVIKNMTGYQIIISGRISAVEFIS